MNEILEEGEDQHLHPIDGFFTDLYTADREPPRFVIKDLLPVGLTFIGGFGMSSFFTFWRAIAAFEQM